jgi:hypothetical protein
MTYVRSIYGTKEDAHMKAESLMPSKILGATAAGADVDEVSQWASIFCWYEKGWPLAYMWWC